MLNFCSQNLFQFKALLLKGFNLLDRGLDRLLSLVGLFMISAVVLTGCGQKGSLYLPEEAPSNTDFIFYQGNKTSEAKDKQVIDQQKIEEAAAQDPQDY